MGFTKDMAHRRFGRLVAVNYVYVKSGCAHWLFKCDCGQKKILNGAEVRRGNSRSCGCLQSECALTRNKTIMIKHGMTKTRVFKIWTGMRARCRNKNASDYYLYGGRGIIVCKRWDSFNNFFKDMGHPPPGTSLDRTDNSKGYSPDNCRWATPKQQMVNTRWIRRFNLNGKLLTYNELAEISGFKRHTIVSRLRRGLAIEEAISRPVQSRNKPTPIKKEKS